MIQSAHAILLLDGKYVLQLRDNHPNISASGQWSLFGGRVEQGEDPAYTVEREVHEELLISPASYLFLWSSDHCAEFEQEVIRMWFFEAQVNEVWGAHRLREGQAVGVFGFEQLAVLSMPQVMREMLRRHYHLARKRAECVPSPPS